MSNAVRSLKPPVKTKTKDITDILLQESQIRHSLSSAHTINKKTRDERHSTLSRVFKFLVKENVRVCLYALYRSSDSLHSVSSSETPDRDSLCQFYRKRSIYGDMTMGPYFVLRFLRFYGIW